MYPLSFQSPPRYSSRVLFVSVAVTLALFSGAEVRSQTANLNLPSETQTSNSVRISESATDSLRNDRFQTYLNLSEKQRQKLMLVLKLAPQEASIRDSAHPIHKTSEPPSDLGPILAPINDIKFDFLTPAQIEATWAAVAKLRGYEVFREETWIMDHLELTVAQRSELAKIFSEDQLVRNEINSGFRERTDLDSTNQELIREEMRKQNERLLARQTETETMVVKLLTASQREKFRLLQESCKFDFAKLDGFSPPKRNAADSKQTPAGLVRPPRDED